MIEIKGNGNIVSREVSVSTFIRLHLAGKGQIELHQSDEEKVIFEADENLQECFSAVNAGRTLYVSTESKFRRPVFTHCLIKVFLRQMQTLYVRCEGGNVVCPNEISLTQPLSIKVQSEGNTQLNLVVPSIKIVCMTEGNVTLQGATEKIDIKTMMEGHFDASQLKAGELSIKNMAEGNVLLHADKTIRISHYGEGYIHYTGNAEVKDVKQYGEGEIKHIKGEPEHELSGE
ncbi:MAG: GIN domain-containing protein [Flavobacteriales bacterium]